MRIEGRQTYATNREVLWSLLFDPQVLEKILPACESFETVALDEHRVTLGIRVGQSIERFSGILRLERVIPFQGFDFRADGQNKDGSVSSRGRITLEDKGHEATVVIYKADIEVTGRPAAISPRMLETTARAFARRSLEALEKQTVMRTRVYTTSTGSADFTSLPATVATSAPRLSGWRLMLALASILLTGLFIWRRFDRRRSRQMSHRVVEIFQNLQGLPDDRAAEPEIPAERSAV